MATIVVEYDENNSAAKKIINMIESLEFFKVKSATDSKSMSNDTLDDLNDMTMQVVEDGVAGKNMTKVKDHKKFFEECLK